MGRLKIRPEIDESKLGLNPLIGDEDYKLRIPARKKSRNVINKFKEPDVKEIYIEATPFTKVFDVTGGKDNMMNLPIRSKELLLYVMYYIDVGCEYIWINRQEYMKNNGIKSVNTFKKAIEDLSIRRYVCPHIKIKDLLWINPYYFFKGDRLGKYPNNIEVLKKPLK